MKWMSAVCFCFIGISVYAAEDWCIDSFSMGVGQSQDKIDVYRFGLRKDSDYHWLPNQTGFLTLYYEASLNYWRKGREDVYAGAFSPVFFYVFGKEKNRVQPYVEGGIGVAAISETKIGNRNMSTGFQFEDRVGAGVKIDRIDFNCRYMQGGIHLTQVATTHCGRPRRFGRNSQARCSQPAEEACKTASPLIGRTCG